MPENKAPDLFAECLQAIQNVHRWHRKLYRRYTLDDETLETHVRSEIERLDFRSKGLCSPQARPILVVLGEVCASTAAALRFVGAMGQQGGSKRYLAKTQTTTSTIY